jgi:hypothetical protein
MAQKGSELIDAISRRGIDPTERTLNSLGSDCILKLPLGHPDFAEDILPVELFGGQIGLDL